MAGWARGLSSLRDRLPESIAGRLRSKQFRYSAGEVPPPPVAPDFPARLFIGPTNHAGQGYQLARAAERLPDVGATSMHAVRGFGFGFSSDNPVPHRIVHHSRRWQKRQFAAVAGGYTHVLFESGQPLFGGLHHRDVAQEVAALRAAGLSVAMVAYGSDLRLPSRHQLIDEWSPYHDVRWTSVPQLEAGAVRFRQLLERVGGPVFVATPDLLLDWPQARWLPIVVDSTRWRGDSVPLLREIPVVLHAPSNAIIKGTDDVEPTLHRLHEEGLIEYRRVQGVQASEMPSLYAGADIVLDQFRVGAYGTTAIEAMAAGRLVIAHIHRQVRDHISVEHGWQLPVVQSTIVTLEAVIREILGNRQKFIGVAGSGPDFVAALHDGAASADVLRPFMSGAV